MNFPDVDNLSRDAIPAVLAQIASYQSALIARLLMSESEASADADELLDVDQAAHRLGVSRAWLYHRSKRLPFALLVGGKRKFSSRGIERYRARKMSV